MKITLIRAEKESRKEALSTLEADALIKEEFYKLKYCSTVVYMVPRA